MPAAVAAWLTVLTNTGGGTTSVVHQHPAPTTLTTLPATGRRGGNADALHVLDQLLVDQLPASFTDAQAVTLAELAITALT